MLKIASVIWVLNFDETLQLKFEIELIHYAKLQLNIEASLK